MRLLGLIFCGTILFGYQQMLAEEQQASNKTSPHTLTGSVTFLSDYRSRGISQTMRRPAVQGELKYQHRSGFYFKSWASNVDGTTHFINNTSMEWDFYVGFEHRLARTDLQYDGGFLFYYYPGGEAFVPARVSYNAVEYYIGLRYKAFNVKFYQTITDYFGVNSENPPFNWEKRMLSRPNGHSVGSPYIEANLEWSFFPKWIANLHIGYQAIINYPQLNYFDWMAALTYKFDWFDVSLSYIATNAKHAYYDIPDAAFNPSIRRLGAPSIVVGVTRTF